MARFTIPIKVYPTSAIIFTRLRLSNSVTFGTGFTGISDIETGLDGNLYILTFDRETDGQGGLYRVLPAAEATTATAGAPPPAPSDTVTPSVTDEDEVEAEDQDAQEDEVNGDSDSNNEEEDQDENSNENE
jgi:aldose sugar dehydrogenase